MGIITRFVLANSLLGLLAALWFAYLLDGERYALLALSIALGAGTFVLVNRYLLRRLRRALKALEFGLLNLQDNDYSITIEQRDGAEFVTLAKHFNAAAAVLRREKMSIYQRELLLDRILQSSSNLLLLFDQTGRVLFSNDAARKYFAQGKRIEGALVADVLHGAPTAFADAERNMTKGLFSVTAQEDGERVNQSWHIDKAVVRIHTEETTMLSFRHMSEELNRQEVSVWKKVIRVISHEINNSLGPIMSMVHSGKMITQSSDDNRLTRVFTTLGDRADHLNQFVLGYAKFARLPSPQKASHKWLPFLQRLQTLQHFNIECDLPELASTFDESQLEQAIINLVTNAHEASTTDDSVTVSVVSKRDGVEVNVLDEGKGMSDDVLAQAFIPFYSTKQRGSGIGLTLVREIVEAHHGVLNISNRDGGGLRVSLWLPN
ncbi:MAG: HAMP domain-containing sensor histidine kinase [Pseudomonadales bacterium]|jgi:nitrogen fixation/metabolism regulation signal transduction histidine kinase